MPTKWEEFLEGWRRTMEEFSIIEQERNAYNKKLWEKCGSELFGDYPIIRKKKSAPVVDSICDDALIKIVEKEEDDEIICFPETMGVFLEDVIDEKILETSEEPFLEEEIICYPETMGVFLEDVIEEKNMESSDEAFVELIEEENESVEETSPIFVGEKVEIGEPKIVNNKVHDERHHEEDNGLLDPSDSAPILPLDCLDDPDHVNGKPAHTFHDPFAAYIDDYPTLTSFDSISATLSFINIYIKPRYTFNISLVKKGSRHQCAIHSKLCIRFIFDPGVRLLIFRICSRLVHDSERYDILLIRGRILHN